MQQQRSWLRRRELQEAGRYERKRGGWYADGKINKPEKSQEEAKCIFCALVLFFSYSRGLVAARFFPRSL